MQRMYKNASKTLSTKRIPKSVAQHRMCLNRINDHARKVGTMVKIDDPSNLEIPMLSSNDKTSLVQTEATDSGDEMRHTVSVTTTYTNSDGTSSQVMTLQSDAGSQLDRERIQALIGKMADIEKTSGSESDKVNIGRLVTKGTSRKRPPIKRLTSAAESNEAFLEKKLVTAIRSVDSRSDTSTKNSCTLTTRMLLPFYKIEDVHHFLSIFQRVDADYSGDLDIDEWCDFFLALDKNVSKKQARTIFNRLNVSGDGCLRVIDLLPVVFGNANKAMLVLIEKYVENELSRRKVRGSNFLTELDLATLFDHYDVNAVGFVSAAFLKEKIRTYNISSSMYFSLVDVLHNVDDDEMVNEHFFVRMFRAYCM